MFVWLIAIVESHCKLNLKCLHFEVFILPCHDLSKQNT